MENKTLQNIYFVCIFHKFGGKINFHMCEKSFPQKMWEIIGNHYKLIVLFPQKTKIQCGKHKKIFFFHNNIKSITYFPQ